MHRSLRYVVLFALCMMVAAPAVFAGTQDQAVVALHAKAKALKAINICASGLTPEDPNTAGIACSEYSTTWGIFSSADVYLIVAQADPVAGIAGVSCGVVAGPNVGIFGWTLCADLDFPSNGWPANGGGDRITWAATTNCQNTEIGGDGVHAVAGAFYLYAYGDDTFAVGPNVAVGGEFRVADCSASESDVSALPGAIGFGNTVGFNACTDQPVPVETTTWSQIKSSY